MMLHAAATTHGRPRTLRIFISLLVILTISLSEANLPGIIHRCMSFWLRGGGEGNEAPSRGASSWLSMAAEAILTNSTSLPDKDGDDDDNANGENMTEAMKQIKSATRKEEGSENQREGVTEEEIEEKQGRKRKFASLLEKTKGSMKGRQSSNKRIQSSNKAGIQKALKLEFTSLVAERKRQFLDRIALISSNLINNEFNNAKLDADDNEHKLNDVIPQSDLTLPGRHFYVVTTACLPWATGTAVNPLLRAAYLHRRTQLINNQNQNQTLSSPGISFSNKTGDSKNNNNNRWVTLVIPWLELPEDQEELYHRVFDSPADQEKYIRNWLREEAGMPDAACPKTGLQLLFYPARYHSGLRSIFAMGDIMSLMDNDKDKMDVCILEEPEHCNWFRAPGDGWTKRFHYVVGIVHTNYKEYASAHYTGLWTAPALAMISSAMIRAYCHKVIKLSPALQTYAPEKESVSNVHGVRSDFIMEGMRRGGNSSSTNTTKKEWQETNSSSSYFIGKLLWAKGLDIMLDLQDYYKQCTGEYFLIDVYGSGPDEKDIQRAFLGRKVFTNTSSPVYFDFKLESMIDNIFRSLSPTNSNQTIAAINAILKRVLEREDEDEADDGDYLDPRDVIALLQKSFGDFDGRDVIANLQKGLRDLPKWGSTLQAEAKQKLDETVTDAKQRLDETLTEAKQKLEMIRKRIDSAAVDLPRSFAELRRTPVPAKFPGRVDHALLKEYKIFVNPSISEVLCTTTAEALAMGKFVIIPYHPSNTFFFSFPNCLAYRSKFEFVANLRWALRHDPEPLSPKLIREFTWEAATDRLIEASAISWREAWERERLGSSKLDERIAWFHNEIGKGVKGDVLRKMFGAGPAADQVKYTYEMQHLLTGLSGEGGEEESGEDVEAEYEDEDDGLSGKFRRSSFAQAIRATVADMGSFIQ